MSINILINIVMVRTFKFYGTPLALGGTEMINVLIEFDNQIKTATLPVIGNNNCIDDFLFIDCQVCIAEFDIDMDKFGAIPLKIKVLSDLSLLLFDHTTCNFNRSKVLEHAIPKFEEECALHPSELFWQPRYNSVYKEDIKVNGKEPEDYDSSGGNGWKFHITTNDEFECNVNFPKENENTLVPAGWNFLPNKIELHNFNKNLNI